MSRSLLLAVLLAIGACGDDDGTGDLGDLGDLVAIDGSVDDRDGSVDGEGCEPSGSCLQGPPCGDDCCGSGERCVQGELGPECACGDGPACEVGDTCSSGIPSEDQCGSVCCGAGDPCPP
ncbi:MAG TPA: hypothetical protein VFU21_30710 [Kofleriaceae bacterium]|nr:hypothetical protein [Kofleriaceae bacterium]